MEGVRGREWKVERLTVGVWAADREHGEDDAEYEEDDGRPGDGDGKETGVKGAGDEFVLAPDDAGEDGDTPSEVVALLETPSVNQSLHRRNLRI